MLRFPLLQLSIVLFSSSASALQCWNCVGEECGSYSSSSPQWELVTCPDGSVCQKTDFVFYSNQRNESLSTYTVRSCSYETGCRWDRSKSCQKNPLQYAGRGCADRFCCGVDKCNGAPRVTGHLISCLLFALVLLL